MRDLSRIFLSTQTLVIREQLFNASYILIFSDLVEKPTARKKFQPIVYLPPYEYLPSFLFSIINKHIVPHLAILYKCPKKRLVDNRAERGTMNETWREENRRISLASLV